MALVVQTDEGQEAGANAYITRAFFIDYHVARGNDHSAYSDDQLDASIVRATDYLDTRFRFRGVKLNETDQTTEWPRKAGSALTQPWLNVELITSPVLIVSAGQSGALVGPNGESITGIPEALKKACAEYALRALASPLFQDAPAPSGGVAIEEIEQTVDVLSQRIKYANGGQATSGGYVLPAYPLADSMLARAGLIESGRVIFR